MQTITAKCPACGAMHTHLPDSADDTATCARCGAIYIPSECVVDAAAIAHEGANAAKNSEAHLRQIASDLHYIAEYLRAVRRAKWVLFLLAVGVSVLGFLGWLFR